MRLQLRWTDPNTQQVRSPTLETPIAFGREFGEMPSAFKGKAIRRMVLASDAVIPFHAILAEHKGRLVISDRQEGTGTLVNGKAGSIQPVNDGDRLTIGPFEITVTLLETLPEAPPQPQADPFATAAAIGFAPGFAAGLSTPAAVSHTTGRAGTESAGIESAGTVSVQNPCDRKVGFLFKRPCNRTTTAGCSHCRNGQIDPARDLYQDDYAYYPNYGRYRRGYWGHDYYHDRDHYSYDPNRRSVDFNESDAASFEQEGDRDYEMDLDAS